MASGAKTTIAFVREQTPGVTPASGWQNFLRTSFNVKSSTSQNDSNEISDSRVVGAKSNGFTDVNGDFGAKFRPRVLDDFLASVFGNDFEGDENQATLKAGDNKITFSSLENFRDIAIYAIANGLQVSDLEIAFDGSGDISTTTTFAGLGFTHSSGTPTQSPSAADERKAYGFKDCTTFEINDKSAAGVACVDSFSVKFHNALEAVRCWGSGLSTPGAQQMDTFSFDGSVTLMWSPMAYEVFKQQVEGDFFKLKFMVGNEDYEYWFEFPKVQPQIDWPEAASGAIKATINLSTAGASPIITRKKKGAAVKDGG